MMREAMSPRELTGVLVRSELQGVTLPEVPARGVKAHETMTMVARARLDLAERKTADANRKPAGPTELALQQQHVAAG